VESEEADAAPAADEAEASGETEEGEAAAEGGKTSDGGSERVLRCVAPHSLARGIEPPVAQGITCLKQLPEGKKLYKKMT